MPTLEISGVPHAYELTSPTSPSDRPVLIFIHGWLLSRKYWKPLVDLLSADYPCLTYDLRGFGESQLNPIARQKVLSLSGRESQLEAIDNTSYSNYSLASYATDLKILLQKLAIKKAWSVGHSLGGSIALWGAHSWWRNLSQRRIRAISEGRTTNCSAKTVMVIISTVN
jgi:2-succinyl-6-hydroxy-2,4-cyclohexadiene-1-carboxylate synthase